MKMLLLLFSMLKFDSALAFAIIFTFSHLNAPLRRIKAVPNVVSTRGHHRLLLLLFVVTLKFGLCF